MKINTVFFDLDGTLIDTELPAVKAAQSSFSEWEIQIQPADMSYVTGRTWESVFEYLFSKYPIPLSQEEAKNQILERYRADLESHLTVVPGSVQAVESLASQFPLALVSGSKRADIFWTLKKLKIEHCFKTILGAEDYPKSKPQPDGYLKGLKILGADPKKSLVFEDSTVGIASGRAAGLWVAAITATNYFEQDHSLAHVRIQDFTSINVDWIHNLSFDSCTNL